MSEVLSFLQCLNQDDSQQPCFALQVVPMSSIVHSSDAHASMILFSEIRSTSHPYLERRGRGLAEVASILAVSSHEQPIHQTVLEFHAASLESLHWILVVRWACLECICPEQRHQQCRRIQTNREACAHVLLQSTISIGRWSCSCNRSYVVRELHTHIECENRRRVVRQMQQARLRSHRERAKKRRSLP